MTTQASNAVLQSADQLRESATGYENVTFTDGKYAPSSPFKGLQVGTAGDIVIVGLNGKKATLSNVLAGVSPLAGKQIIETGTTATGITALF